MRGAAAGHKASSVVIALGSNVGNRGRNAWWAIQQLIKNGVQVERCSGLYETAPAYVEDQPAFLNAAVLARTRLTPPQLLATLKSIEEAAGRDVQGGPRWGPRPLDLDIIFMTGQPYQDHKLQVPHPRWREREFVLHPVSDLWYTRIDPHTVSRRRGSPSKPAPEPAPCPCPPQGAPSAAAVGSIAAGSQLDPDVLSHVKIAYDVVRQSAIWVHGRCDTRSLSASTHPTAAAPAGPSAAASSALPVLGTSGTVGVVGSVMSRVTPMRAAGVPLVWGERTRVMGILNITPDSFSDGGSFLAASSQAAGDVADLEAWAPTAAEVERVVAAARQMVADGADILDVGGQSTRPGATRLSAEQELARVLPVIRALRQCPDLAPALISVDTFYARVAQEAVAAGADIVNDVSGGRLDPHMFQQVAELGVPYVVMHMRGDPATMQQPQHTQYGEPGVVAVVGEELQATLDAAVAAGIPAWNIITDPGLGFSKSAPDSIRLLRDLPQLRATGLQGAFSCGPMLVGPSRKGFLGKLTGRSEPKERDAATVAAAVACVTGGADIVRAHNVRDVKDGLRVADVLYRQTL